MLAEQRGERSNEYVFELGGYEPLCRFDEAVFEAYHNDYLGTPRELTDEQGQIVWSTSYDVYGQIGNLSTSIVENHLRFQGQYKDTETGLHYNFYRYYDPSTGRYVSQDPIGPFGGLNLYFYTQNPVMWVDPLGLVIVYHYTNRKGYNAIKAGENWLFKASQPPGDHPRGAYFTPLAPDDRRLHRLRIPREKREFFFKMDIPENQLKRHRGGRGEYVWYTLYDIEVKPKQQLGHGGTC